MQIDSAPDIAFKAGVEQSRRVLERSALGESQLHDALVRLAGADQSIVRPNRNASPLPLLDHLRVSLFDESADMGERLAPPVVQFLDSGVDQPRRGFALGRCALFHIVCTSCGCFSILRSYQSPIIRASLHGAGIRSCIPPKSNRKAKITWNTRIGRSAAPSGGCRKSARPSLRPSKSRALRRGKSPATSSRRRRAPKR